jgi:hypothetical protein
MKSILRVSFLFILMLLPLAIFGCDHEPNSDQKQSIRQEALLQNGVDQVGMPNIKNFRELKEAKMILEMRDQESLNTYTYTRNDFTGKFTFVCNSIGYPLPYATQFTSPQKEVWHQNHGYSIVPQADPNGLYTPASAEGTWVICKDPSSDKVGPSYIEPKVSTFLWKLPASQVQQ